jgi:hypothetical protein
MFLECGCGTTVYVCHSMDWLMDANGALAGPAPAPYTDQEARKIREGCVAGYRKGGA